MEHRILIIEKDIAIREYISLALVDEGYKIASTKDGYYALEFAKYFKPDLFILDIPGVVCPEAALLRTYRKAPVRQVPVLALSTCPQPDSLDALFALGPIDILFKPFQLNELLDRVSRQIYTKDKLTRVA